LSDKRVVATAQGLASYFDVSVRSSLQNKHLALALIEPLAKQEVWQEKWRRISIFVMNTK
jgi:hypothetical protein